LKQGKETRFMQIFGQPDRWRTGGTDSQRAGGKKIGKQGGGEKAGRGGNFKMALKTPPRPRTPWVRGMERFDYLSKLYR